MISIIVPVYNEENVLREQRDYFLGLSEQAEVIFVDGGSTDQTRTILKDFPRVITCAKGRAIQMNTGAANATGQIYLFLHADTRVDYPTLRRIEEEIKDGELVGGCLRQVIDAPGLLYRWIAWTGNMRAGLRGVFYGDQGIFVDREAFHRLGGFPVHGIGEDIMFTKRLRRSGRVRMLDA
ncbi:MAG: glycosyltransferase family 2 protein, partial [Candidatus Omnitrophica bacterium]|nr:glycosyltransferase family 2 protein [Candidatus Omnitrophota bacterium]